ncbi:MAG TPA: cytochrome P450 [Myxococcales bacterium]|nr:cytochrome P450 [Deltaproteobacteria bacterium]MBU52963.1 cytochrome P450 [Deltaproteobacteria bacterium]HAA57611.1 cytochrome P450 [Myxococcales bacterium]
MSSKQVPQSCPFHPQDPNFNANPFPVLKELREAGPVVYWEEGQSWLVTSHEDVIKVFRDNDLFSTNFMNWEHIASMMGASSNPVMEEIMLDNMMMLPTKEHGRIRRLVRPAFTPRAVEKLAPTVQKIVDEMLEEAEKSDSFELVSQFAEPIPARVMSAILKIPEEARETFNRFTLALLMSYGQGDYSEEEKQKAIQHSEEGLDLIRDLIEARRKNLQEDDLLSILIENEEKGERLNTKELVSMVAGLIAGGFETTVSLITFVTWHILQRPELKARIDSDPSVLLQTIEEVLRFDHFTKMGVYRYATQDTELGGVEIKKGQRLVVLINSALRDESVFTNPDTFDLERDRSASVAFGYGVHFCLGAHLARLEVRIAVGTLLKRFPNISVVQPPVFGFSPVVRKVDTLQLKLHHHDA